MPTQLKSKRKSKAAAEKRIRRTPEEAQKLILDAAESSMGAEGPAGLRLQDVARIAGVSHPTILHHFGSRDGLVRALHKRALEELSSTVTGQMGSPGGLHATFKAYRDGIAQRMLWLMQSEDGPPKGGLAVFDAIAASLHALRVQHARPGGPAPDMEETRNVVHLVAIAAFGDALIGKRMRGGAKDDAAARARFESWFGQMIETYLRAKG